MTEPEPPTEPPEPPIHLDADKARAGDVVLRKRWERWVFVGGLVALAVVVALLAWGWWG